MRKVILLLLILVIGSSCIPNKELVYFQGEPVSKESIKQIQNKPYRLQVNDMLYIDIKSADSELVQLFKNVEQQNTNTSTISQEAIYFRSYSIDRHGNIRIPYIGELNVLGYTTSEVREKIEKEFENYFKNPEDVFVTVKLAGIRLTFLGEVKRPGTVIVYQNQVNIIEAIASAGDIAVTGNRKNVTVIRKGIDGTKKYHINLLDVNSFESDMFYVESNDIIYIEPLKQKSWGTGTSGMQTITSLIAVLSLVTTTILLINAF
ncbi:MAG: sugar transporter [Bacteroidetes bacterium]|nr:MAG: sugar transporter [Bacteroidota bacterium]